MHPLSARLPRRSRSRAPRAQPAVRAILRSATIQPKLKIGAVDDPAEHEADRVADAVMRMAEPAAAANDGIPPVGSARRQGDVLQRKCACGDSPGPSGECAECAAGRESSLQRRAANHAEPEAVPPLVHEILRSPGQPLDHETRAFIEPRFGHDFSTVRVHANARAAEAASLINARAFTSNHSIVFGTGEYAPQTESGRRLLAHELAHTVQQDSAHIRRQPVINAGNGTTDELKKELKRLEAERSKASEKCVGGYGSAHCPPEVEQYYRLIEKLKSRIAERGDSKLQECDLKLIFNGSVLQLSGKYNGSFHAVSGKPVDGKFDYSKGRQKAESTGPIPEGEYWINPDEIKSLWYYPSKNAWGTHRITIHPYDATPTFGRGGFFIHGGSAPGSAGCIDLTDEILYFATMLEQFAGCKIHLSVSYPQANKSVSTTGKLAAQGGSQTEAPPMVYICSKDLDTSPVGSHAFFRVGSPQPGHTTYSLGPVDRGDGCWQGVKGINYPSDYYGQGDCRATGIQLSALISSYNAYPTGHYCTLGPNSNTFVGVIARQCGIAAPDPEGLTPGIDDAAPSSGTYAPSKWATMTGCTTHACVRAADGVLRPVLPELPRFEFYPDGTMLDRETGRVRLLHAMP